MVHTAQTQRARVVNALCLAVCDVWPIKMVRQMVGLWGWETSDIEQGESRRSQT
jgi:hypothetical protein